MQQKYLFDCTPRFVSSFKVHIFSMRCFLNEKVLQTNDETQWNP